jgi:hypothetical protein
MAALQQELAAARDAACDEPAASVEEDDGADAAMPDVAGDAANVPLPEGDKADNDIPGIDNG